MLVRLDQWYARALTRITRDSAAPTDPLRRLIIAGVTAGGGVLLVSALIGMIMAVVQVSNISLLYLVLVICLAIAVGRGAAILGAILAFLAYDFFFIPPVHLFTVDRPTEWVSLAALLLTGLVVGQLTAEVRQREQIAVASQQRTARLYALAQAIAAETDQERLVQLLTQQIVTVFSSAGVAAGMLWLPDEAGQFLLRATAHRAQGALHHLDAPDYVAHATAAAAEQRITALVDPTGTDTHLTCFLPLVSSGRVLGILGLHGTAALLELLTQLRLPAPDVTLTGPLSYRTEQAYLFAAFCDQYALALERATLHATAIHVAALRESDRLKNALLGSVTHDLRTPIAAIQAAASSLQQTDIVWSAGERDELLATITTSSVRLARLVDNLLALSHLEAGGTPVQKQVYPINDVIATVLDQLDLTGSTKGRALHVAIADDPLEAPMDHTQIERVVMNLVENAVKYSPPGSPITIRARQKDGELCVAVMDRGVGIPPGQLTTIFDKFYRLQQPLPWTRETPPQGTGLGLAICAGIVREHGGRIWAESRGGHGATFTFTLPLAEAAAPPVAPTPAALIGGCA